MLVYRQTDALGESVRAFLKALDDALIFVSKSDRPPFSTACGFPAMGSPAATCIATAAVRWPACSSGETHAATRNTGKITAAKRIIMVSFLKGFFDVASTRNQPRNSGGHIKQAVTQSPSPAVVFDLAGLAAFSSLPQKQGLPALRRRLCLFWLINASAYHRC